LAPILSGAHDMKLIFTRDEMTIIIEALIEHRENETADLKNMDPVDAKGVEEWAKRIGLIEDRFIQAITEGAAL
jgi:hypothetical protein